MSKNKKCSGCKEVLPIENFYKNKLVIDGHSNYCIDCTRENSKKYFVRKKEKLSKLENDNLMKIALLSNTDSNNADNLMKIMMIEKMCKTILEELEHLKRDFVKTEMDVLK
jgi:hypothetical protein